MRKLKGFFCAVAVTDVDAFCFAESAGKARSKVLRSAHDAGYTSIKYAHIKIRRAPELDGRVPKNYRNEVFALEHMKYLPVAQHD